MKYFQFACLALSLFVTGCKKEESVVTYGLRRDVSAGETLETSMIREMPITFKGNTMIPFGIDDLTEGQILKDTLSDYLGLPFTRDVKANSTLLEQMFKEEK